MFDKVGAITIDTLQKGEYVLGMYDHTVSVSNQEDQLYDLSVLPNPSNDTFNINYDLHAVHNAYLQISAIDGKVLIKHKISINEMEFKWNATGLADGIYILQLIINKRPVKQLQLIHIN